MLMCHFFFFTFFSVEKAKKKEKKKEAFFMSWLATVKQQVNSCSFPACMLGGQTGHYTKRATNGTLFCSTNKHGKEIIFPDSLLRENNAWSTRTCEQS